MIGFLNFLIVDNNKKLSISPDEILKAGTSILFKKIALFSSKGVERKVILFLSQYFLLKPKRSSFPTSGQRRRRRCRRTRPCTAWLRSLEFKSEEC